MPLSLQGAKVVERLFNGSLLKVLVPVLITAITGAIIWVATISEQMRQMVASQQVQDVKIERMDNIGTRALVIIEDRQKNVIHRLDVIEQRLDRLERQRAFQQQ